MWGVSKEGVLCKYAGLGEAFPHPFVCFNRSRDDGLDGSRYLDEIRDEKA